MFEEDCLCADPVNVTFAWVCALVDEFQRCEVRHIVICPGSRSTPLALAFADQPAIRYWVLIDERSAAFFALGMAKRLGQPVALLCTSGTAAANFFPALVEAKLAHVPLVVLTADRPHELRDCGAPQTIDQVCLYGGYVKWFCDLPLPEATDPALRFIRTVAGRAVFQARANPMGPVHLNIPLREPLTPVADGKSMLAQEARDALAWRGRLANAPYIEGWGALQATLVDARLAALGTLLREKRRGLIIVGATASPALVAPLLDLARLLGYPVLADPLSPLRCGLPGDASVLSSYDAFLRDETFVATHEPQLVLRIGTMPTAKTLLLYLERYKHSYQVVVDGWGEWLEPTLLAAEMLHTDPAGLCQALLDWYERHPDEVSEEDAFREWGADWIRADQLTRTALRQALEGQSVLFEGRIFTELQRLLPEGATLYVGNSMPIRDLDTFFWCRERSLTILGNRGANGIDGVISSALGASTTATPTVLVIGDLSFFHDLNGLLAARLFHLNLVIVLVNNDGGGIFSFLPQASYPRHFESLFGTPTGLEFEAVVSMYGGRFHRVETWELFRERILQGLAGGLHVIELRTERAANVEQHRQLWQVVKAALAGGAWKVHKTPRT